MTWIAIDIVPPIALMVAGLAFLDRGDNPLGFTLIVAGFLQISALNALPVWSWWIP